MAGYNVHEALWADEVAQLLETERIDLLLITHDVDDPEVKELQSKLTTLRLEPQTTVKDVVWELSELFPPRAASAQ
jgi:ABC-type nitrate/sulfonate/bicarbonate transport system ATPase subunit